MSRTLGSLEDRRQVRRVRIVRALFLVALLSWGSLTAWWATYFARANRQIQDLQMELHAATVHDLAALARQDPSVVTKWKTYALVHGTPSEDEAAFPFARVDADHVVVVADQERRRLRTESRSKAIMLAGEGTLLFALLFACLVALYRLLLSEWRLNRQTEAFVHAVTHELKSPLAGLRALLQSFRTIRMSPEEAAGYHELGLVEVARLEHLVGNILLSSRLEAASYRPQPTVVELGQAARRVAERKQIRLRELQGEVVVTGSVEAFVDPEALDTIVENLVDNALKYGGEPPHVRIEVSRVGQTARLAVIDDGPGIEPGERARVFEKFYRSPEGERRHAKGTGLGLYLCRGLAWASRGVLRVEDGPDGRGCAFVLELPVP